MSAQCTLIADETDDAVQLVLGFIALSSLYGKWHFETPRRSAKIWFMDAMKQGTSAAMVHVVNIIFSIGIADFSTQPGGADECAFYFMNVAIDTTLGVYIAYLLLQLVTAVAVRRDWSSLKHPGRYGDPPCFKVWFIQLLSWSAVLLVMKIFVGLAIYIFSAPLGLIGALLFFPVHHHPKIELLIVMIGCPLVMNMVQFWIQDSFLKDHTNTNDSSEELPLLNKPASVSSASTSPAKHHDVIKLNGGIPLSKQQHQRMQKKNSFTNATTAADMYDDL
uniref:Uncharacterized protein n=1 Tax=Globisporangium ultimum (strain ATCC 200006 / CBS 805.95 / DAOM BR144) TaxID=431595 RepID=K3X9C8_GLOUD